MATAQKLLVNYKPMEKSSVATSDGVTFATDRRPRNQKDKSNITCFSCGVSGHYSAKNSCKQEDTDKYNTTKKLNETINSSLFENNYKRSTDTPVEDTGTQMIMLGIGMDDFVDSPYYLMPLKKSILNEETNADHRSGTIFPSSTSHEHTLSQSKDAINRN